MKEYLLQELKGLVELTREGLAKGAEILQVQAPEVVRQLFRWEFTISLIGCLLFIGILTATIILLVKEIGKTKEDNSYSFFDDPGPYAFPFMVGGIISLFSLLFINLNWLKILVAPKLFLIEYLSGLIK